MKLEDIINAKDFIKTHERAGFKKDTHICTKCNGTGFIAMYGYYKNGKCFVCNGKGRI